MVERFCVIVSEFALDAECMRNSKTHSHCSQRRAFAGKEQEGFWSTDRSDGTSIQTNKTKPSKARTEEDKHTYASGCSPLRQRKLFMDSDIFFKVPSCSLGSEFGSSFPECVSTGAPLYHSVMGRCVLGALDHPAVCLMKLFELASGQYCYKLAEGHLMVLLNFCLECHSPGTYSIVINVCVTLSRLL